MSPNDPARKPKFPQPLPNTAPEATSTRELTAGEIPDLDIAMEMEDKTDPSFAAPPRPPTPPPMSAVPAAPAPAPAIEDDVTSPSISVPRVTPSARGRPVVVPVPPSLATRTIVAPSQPTPPPPMPASLAPQQPAAAPVAYAMPISPAVSPQPQPPQHAHAPQAAAPAPAPAAPRFADFGPIESLMRDPTITEIMVNDTRNVVVEKDGKLMLAPVSFPGVDELNRLMRGLLEAGGRSLNGEAPYADVMLPDGSRVNVIGPPLTVGGPCLTIRKFPARFLTSDDLIASGTLDQRVAYFLNACVLGRMNILVCGGAGAGKTTLLGALTAFVSKVERIVTIEDTPELRVPQPNSVRLQTKPAGPGSTPVTARDLVANALRMRPDRIIVGECRRHEAFDVLQAMNTGHSGSMTTLHANSPRDGLSRLETLCMMAGEGIPLAAIRKQMASALDLVIQVQRFKGGARRVTAVTEVTGTEGDVITTQDIYTWDEASGFKGTGFVPTLVTRLKSQGIELPQGFF